MVYLRFVCIKKNIKNKADFLYFSDMLFFSNLLIFYFICSFLEKTLDFINGIVIDDFAIILYMGV